MDIRRAAPADVPAILEIFRIAKAYMAAHGVARACFSFCLGIMDYVRIDTHENNHTMQSAITGYGFRKCGNIYASNGTLRTAYDFIRP